MKMIKLQDLAQIEISNVDKKSIEGETSVKLCNFVDVYYNWAITAEMTSQLMDATAKENQIAKFTLRKGQVAITKDSETRDDIGVATYIADDMPGVILGYHCVLITPNENLINGKYLNVIFHSPYAQKYFEANASGSGQRYTLTNEIVGEFPIPVIEIEKQKQIGDLFSNIDRKIANNRVICADLESMAKLLYDYWFVQFDFPDENGKPYKSSGGKMVWNEELKREIPEGWEAGTFGDCIASINTGLNPRDNFKLNTGGTIRYLTVKNLTKEGTVDFSSCDCIDEEARAIVHRRSDIRIGDILFASIAPLGRCYVIKEDPKTWDINESVFSIRPNYKIATSNFLYMTFMSDSFVKKAEGSSTGSVFKGIRISELQDLKTIIPKKAVLDKFDDVVEKLFAAKSNAFNENMDLASLRDFLLPMLMNGQVKVCNME